MSVSYPLVRLNDAMRWGDGAVSHHLEASWIKANGEFEGVGLRSQQNPQSELKKSKYGGKGRATKERRVRCSRGLRVGVGGLGNWRSCKGRREAPESREVEATLHSILGLRWGGISRHAPLLCWRLDRIDPMFSRALASTRCGHLDAPRRTMAWLKLRTTRQVF